MRILMLNTFDVEGGAAKAAYRLHKGLQAHGAESKLLVQHKTGGDDSVIVGKTAAFGISSFLRRYIDALPLLRYRDRKTFHWSTAWWPTDTVARVKAEEPDIVHLHWTCWGFLSISDLARLPGPVVWTLHDSWAFTGGCHVPGDCLNYQDSCGRCPQLSSNRTRDLSSRTLERKKRYWQNVNLTIVTPSRWLGDCARRSAILGDRRIETIPNGIDTTVYRPIDKQLARQTLRLPPDKRLILFAAMHATSDPNKGADLLFTALRELGRDGWGDKAGIIVLGASPSDLPSDLGIPVTCLDFLKDDVSMVLAYSAADVTVVPSRQENLPNMVMESLACGTPAVGFRIGGVPELILHSSNGYIAEPFSTHDLAKGIGFVIEDEARHEALCISARKRVEADFNIPSIASRYAALYESLLK
jgi:glycosyltransferase involved in cell wall biosynthesis